MTKDCELPFYDLFKQIDDCSIVVTPNRRLSSFLNKHYDQYQIDLGRTHWNTPYILPLHSYLETLWRDYVYNEQINKPILLNSFQTQYLWENIIESTNHHHTLLDISETANLANNAWNLIHQWEIDIDDQFLETEDYKTFRLWANQFSERCGNSWIDSANLSKQLMTLIKEKKITLPRNIFLVGFLESYPALSHFLDECAYLGIKIEWYAAANNNVMTQRISFSHEDDEIITTARYIKQRYSMNPDASYGIIVPSLEIKRNRITQLFTQVFDESEEKIAFNISVGKQLIHYPIISAALSFLKLCYLECDSEDFVEILSSPFMGDAEKEHNGRSIFTNLIYKHNIKKINLKSLLTEHVLKQMFLKHCPLLAERCEKLITSLDSQEHFYFFHEWSPHFLSTLLTLGWPGERSLTSEEYQIVNTLPKALENFASLDFMKIKPYFQQSLKQLKIILSNTTFQPESPAVNIHVLGVLEALCLPFDYVWMIELDELKWPGSANPNPFIPKRIQHKINMPHATAEREYYYCKLILDQIVSSNKNVIFSHVEKNEESHVAHSPIINNVASTTINDLPQSEFTLPSHNIFMSRNIIIFNDHLGPSLNRDQSDVALGGTHVLKLQALCPFRAFAEIRLHAKKIESLSAGLNKLERGTMIHKIMELIWNKIKTHENLLNTSQEEIELLLLTTIDVAMKSFQNLHPHIKNYFEIEKSRLNKVLNDWLLFEKNRESFIVSHHEHKAEIKIGNLKLSVRVDRIDELANGKKIIIDYKTSLNYDISSWFSERIEEPQLPCYTLIDQDGVCGIAYAHIVSGNHCFKGIGTIDVNIDGIKTLPLKHHTEAQQFREQINQWSNDLTTLSDSFNQGLALVNPKNSETTCYYCDLKPFCRIYENNEQAY